MPSLGFMVSTPVVLALLGKLWPVSNRNLYMRTFVTPHKLLKWGRAWQLGTSAGHVVIRGLPSFSLSILLSVVLAPFWAWSCDGCNWSTDPLRSGSEQRKRWVVSSQTWRALSWRLSQQAFPQVSSLTGHFSMPITVFTQYSFGEERFGGVHSPRHLLSVCAFDQATKM